MTEEEFDDFYAASFTRISGQLYAMIGDRDEAQECVQEAFVRAWAQRRRLCRPKLGKNCGRNDHVALVAALRQLPEAQRRALVLHHVCDLPVHAVAAEIGVPEGTVKARLSRGRAALAALLTDDPGLQEGASHV